ncbi:putative cytochrome P450 [Macrophomina phaseolina]|uniref:Cytochrome P450 n=1 Tax=Macrophomina phaseolina TaxID=35725 RepID=A0ABQ8GVZ5_9PEZI|nr:putative cytochrome P450 [Macrophomina phaseolina]
MGFGQDTHTCPGCFFASNEVKVALIYLLLMYGIHIPDGVTERPQSLQSSGEYLPDPTAKIMFRWRDEMFSM